MIDLDSFIHDLQKTPLHVFSGQFVDAIKAGVGSRVHGDLPTWQNAVSSLPELAVSKYQLDSDAISISADETVTDDVLERLTQSLMTLQPWRKGPFRLFDVFIDTEWHSDWKWQRLEEHIHPLKDRLVLDVGCGNGYHCWRMRGAGARFVLGVDPMPKFICQFQAIKRYLPHEPVHLLPLAGEDVPQTGLFDTVFSMGVLYHRRSPLEHLQELKNSLRPQGQLVLETLIVEGDEQTVLMPEDRYAGMRNVWFIPSTKALENWLHRLGFVQIRTVDINQTSCEEQRRTSWMENHSLADFLDPDNHQLTREGYPAPRRAIIIAEKK